jgi:serine/threonine protein phosphatase 1
MDKFGSLDIFNSQKIVAIGDIHGEIHKLEKLVKKIWRYLDDPSCHLVFCGDYFDRGVNSPKVFEFLVELKKNKTDQVYFIRGNHEIMLLDTLVDLDMGWLRWTSSTLDQMVSYWGIKRKNSSAPDDFFIEDAWDWEDRPDLRVVSDYCKSNGFIDFLKSLIPYYENNEVICTHAPIDRLKVDRYFQSINPKEKLLDTLNTSWPFIEESKNQLTIPQIPKFLICGHQAPLHGDIDQARIFNQRAFIDTGCGLSPKRPLTAFVYPQKKCFQEF